MLYIISSVFQLIKKKKEKKEVGLLTSSSVKKYLTNGWNIIVLMVMKSTFLIMTHKSVGDLGPTCL